MNNPFQDIEQFYFIWNADWSIRGAFNCKSICLQMLTFSNETDKRKTLCKRWDKSVLLF